MKHLPHNATAIQLSASDMSQAVEYWLNTSILKEPCTVIAIKELTTMEGGRFEIEFDRSQNESPTFIPTVETEMAKDFMGAEPIHGMDKK